MKSFVFIGLFLLTIVSCAQKNTKGVTTKSESKKKTQAKEIINDKGFDDFEMKNEFGGITLQNTTNNTELIFQVATTRQPKFIYNLATRIPIFKADYPKGSVFLLSFKAKTTISSLETGEAKVLWILKQSNSYKDNITATISLKSDWQTYYIPFQATKEISAEDLAVIIQYGYKEQSFLLKDASFKSFAKGTKIEELPKTKITYSGMEPDAQWRKDALVRIDEIRKGDFSVILTKRGAPISNKMVNIKLKKHFFSFGGIIRANFVNNNTQEYQNFKTAFQHAVFENDLKIKHWAGKPNKERTLNAISILKQDNISLKGHVLIWPGFNYLTKKIRENKDNPKKVANLINTHVKDILTFTKGNISSWDVVNEVYTNKDLQNITGSEALLYNGFRLSKKLQPHALRFTNEYGIISKGGIDTAKQEWYYNFIKRIDENTGGLVQGVGIQSHIGSDLTPPERVLEILDYYATLDKKISISEFTMDIQEPEIREQYTRDFMIVAFSHPNVSEFVFWGSTQDRRKKVDIFTPNGEIGSMGKAYFDLVHDQWNTNISIETNEKGTLKGQGFYGTYEYSLMLNNKLITGTFVFEPNAKNTFVITM